MLSRRAFARPAFLVIAAGAVGLAAWLSGRPGRCGATICAPAAAPREVVYPLQLGSARYRIVVSPDELGRGNYAVFGPPEITVTDRDLRCQKWDTLPLRGALFDHCDLRGVDLRGADLRGACFFECDLRGANLADADLRGADLRGVRMLLLTRDGYASQPGVIPIVQGALYDRHTHWPTGFRPEAHGARLVE